MKKTVFTLAMALMAVLLVGCNNDWDMNPRLSDQIIGKWIVADINDQPALTNEKAVITFTSATKAYMSASFTARPENSSIWGNQQEADVAIIGKKVSLTRYISEHNLLVNELYVSSITANETRGRLIVKSVVNGTETRITDEIIRLVRVNDDFCQSVLGLWEGNAISVQDAHTDFQKHRWELKDDGSYIYYRQNEKGQWVDDVNTYAEYFVDGNLLCMRWANANGLENREWWEIVAADDNGMVWKGLRKNAAGETYTAAFSMTKVKGPTKAEIEQKIIGKWMEVAIDGTIPLTQEKTVTTFVSPTKAYVSSSKADFSEPGTKWSAHREYDVQIEDRKVTVTGHPNEGITLINEYSVNVITDYEIFCDFRHTTLRNGEVINTEEWKPMRLQVVLNDYQNRILGIWEGYVSSSQSPYGTDEYYRWIFAENGTFLFFRPEGEKEWVLSDDAFAEYFMDGTLLCFRWKNNGEGKVEQRDWWEVSLDEDGMTMTWIALCKKEDGTLYNSVIILKRINAVG